MAHTFAIGVVTLIIFCLGFLYMLPSIIAYNDGKSGGWFWLILFLNLFFGGTIIVWLLLLVWAWFIHENG